MRRALAPLTALLLLAYPALAWATPSLDAQAGYAAVYSPARPLPVRVQLSLPVGEAPFAGLLVLEAWQEEGGAPRCIHALREVELGPGSAKHYLLEFRPDRSKGVRLRLLDGKARIVAERVFAYGVELQETPPGVPLVGTLRVPEGRTALYWPNAYRHWSPEDTESPPGAVAVEVGRELLAPGGLGGLSGLVIAEGQSLEGPELQALEDWVYEGGQLLVAPGSRPLDEDHPLSGLLPFLPKSQRRVRGAVAEFEPAGGEGSASLLTGVRREGAWVTHAAPDGTPVVLSWSRGRGRVSLLTAALRAPALGSEEVRAALFARAFAFDELQPRGAPRVDVLEQSDLRPVRQGAEKEVDRAWIGLLVMAFLFVVGPLDYLLWRWRPGPRMTWITLTVSSLGFSALAFLVGTRGTGPGLEARATWIVDAFPDGSAAADGMFVVAGRRHSAYRLRSEQGLRFYLSGTPESGEARLQGDILLGPSEARFNLGLGACLPLRVRGRLSSFEAPLQARWVGAGQVELTRAPGVDGSVETLVVTAEGRQSLRVGTKPERVDLSALVRHSDRGISLVDEEGLMHQNPGGAGLWTSAARILREKCQGDLSGFSAFDDPIDGVHWGLERSAWLRRGHVVVIAKLRSTPGLVQSPDLSEALARRGLTFVRIQLAPEREGAPPEPAKEAPSQAPTPAEEEASEGAPEEAGGPDPNTSPNASPNNDSPSPTATPTPRPSPDASPAPSADSEDEEDSGD